MSDRHRYVCPSCRVVLRLREKDFPFRCQCGQRIESHHDIGLHLSMGIEALRQEGGPGSEFASLAASIGIHEAAGCDCQTIKREMDLLGVYGCRGRREQLLAKLRHSAKQYGWWDRIKAGGNLLRTGQIFQTGVTLEGLLDEAILRAEAMHVAASDQAVASLLKQAPRDSQWRLRKEILIAQRTLLDRVAAAEHRPPEWFAGRGIVTLGGTAKYFGAAWVLVSVLRQLGCNLPVEWWYLGPEEMDARMIDLAQSLGNVRCVNLRERLAVHRRHPRRIAGWEAKVWAMMYSRFEEVLWLDADNVPARDPSFLFDAPEYRDTGAVFWPDFPPEGWSVTTAAFEVARLPIPGRTAMPQWRNPTDYRPFETGQILVHKPSHWRHLELTAAICDASDFWFPSEYKGRANWYIYGDKDAFYLAFSRCGGFTMPPESADVEFWGDDTAGAFIQRDFGGQIVFQHRVQPPVKWRLHDDNKQVPGTDNHDLCLAALDELRRTWIGQVYDAGDETEQERAIAAQLQGHKVWFCKQAEPAFVMFLPRGKCHPRQWHWTIRSEHLCLSTFDRRVAVLGRDDKGNWCNHGTGDFLLDAPPEGFDLPLEKQEVVIWHEVVRDNEYRLPDQFEATDTILDIGGHCGMFAWACLNRGAGKVISVEPHPENFARLERNLAPFGERSTRIPAAALDKPGLVHLAQPEGAKHTGGWCAINVHGGVTAPALPFDQLVPSHCRLVKLDCEGSEWPILSSCTRWDHIDAWCGEFHLAPCPMPPVEGLSWLRQVFEEHGYVVRIERHSESKLLGHFWAVRPEKG